MIRTLKEDYKDFIALNEKAHEIINSLTSSQEPDPWKIIYNKIFSDEISSSVRKIYPFDWHSPDCGYDDDVRAFMYAFDEATDNVKQMLENMD